MICDDCKSQDALVHMIGIGNFCRRCHNRRIADQHGYTLFDDYIREIIVRDAEGQPHHFEINNLLMPGISEWTAVKVGDGYEFSLIVKPEDSQLAAMQRLHRKIVAGLQHQTLNRSDCKCFLDNALQTDGGQYTLNATGCGRIVSLRDSAGHGLMIDGRQISAEAFFKLLSQYEGWNFSFQITEPSDDFLEKGMVLVPLQIEASAMLERFEETLSWFLEGNVLNAGQEYGLSSALYERITEYEALCRLGDRAVAKTVGQAMIIRLEAIEHNSDHFPEYHVMLIRKAMPWFGDDEPG